MNQMEKNRVLRQLVALKSLIEDGYGGRTVENIVANLEARLRESISIESKKLFKRP